MINVANLVLAVKDKKEKDFELFDKIRYICQNLGKEYHENRIDCYSYEGDNLEMYFIQDDSFAKSPLQNVSVEDEHSSLLFDYLYDSSLKEGKVNKYIPGEWEKLVDNHYNMSLSN
jgi:hypothetical protein